MRNMLLRNTGAIKALNKLRSQKSKKIVLSNFQKNKGTIVTSGKSICEITAEVMVSLLSISACWSYHS